MIHLSAQQTTSEVLFAAFRAAYVTTFAGMVEAFRPDPEETATPPCPLFLDDLSLTSGCAPQVQLSQLLNVWWRMQNGYPDGATHLDHCVCYCAVGRLARAAEANDERILRAAGLQGSESNRRDRTWLASQLRTLQITWPFPQDSALVVRDHYLSIGSLDCTPAESGESDALLDIIGHWHVAPEILTHARDLLTDEEMAELGQFFRDNPRLMNL